MFFFSLAQVTVMPRKWAGNGLLGQDLSFCVHFMDVFLTEMDTLR